MDETETERLHFMTPLLSPHTSESSTSEYFDLECSFSSRDYQRQRSNSERDLQELSDILYQSANNENESDIQDQQPIEATDDSNDPSHSQTTTVDVINDSLHLKPSQEHNDDSLSLIQEIEAVQDSFSNVMSDIETIPIEERPERPILKYSLSLCVPYTDEENEADVSNIIETLVTTEFTEIVKKDKCERRHIMISYNHSTKVICSKISKYLKNRNYIVWIDQHDISGDIYTSMAAAVENSFLVLMAINEPYQSSRYCRLEAEYAVERNKASIPMLMQTGYKPLGWLGLISSGKLHIDFSQLPFDEAFDLLIREIEAIRISLGIDDNDQDDSIPVNNQITTTMDNSWSHLQNVHEWTVEDVIEWLNREKLEMFEDALSNFTGATLCQLYKIKIDSPSDYYRMTDSLLPPTITRRLFHNLKFFSTLDTLFSTSSHPIH